MNIYILHVHAIQLNSLCFYLTGTIPQNGGQIIKELLKEHCDLERFSNSKNSNDLNEEYTHIRRKKRRYIH